MSEKAIYVYTVNNNKANEDAKDAQEFRPAKVFIIIIVKIHFPSFKRYTSER